MATPRTYTQEEKQFIQENKHLGPKQLSKVMDIPYNSLRAYFKNHKVTSGIDTTFKKGNQPWNKGTKGLMIANSGSFKKGNKPHNTLFDGMITSRTDKSGLQYKYIRISESNWMLYQRYLWEKHNGEIPDGYLVTFKDGNQLNCVIENLQLTSKEDNMLKNSLHNYPEEIVKSYQLIAAITRKLNRNAKKQN